MPFNEIAPRLKGDLMRDFGLSRGQAAGVVGNLAGETGGFRHMQEISPLVPGSRGGFGYAQWTGPRRREFEAWTQARGLDPNSYEANYGFLRHEMQNTPERRVLGALLAAPDAASATQVFSDQFLRPGIPHMDGRQRWTQRAMQFAPAETDAGMYAEGPPSAFRDPLQAPPTAPQRPTLPNVSLDEAGMYAEGPPQAMGRPPMTVVADRPVAGQPAQADPLIAALMQAGQGQTVRAGLDGKAQFGHEMTDPATREAMMDWTATPERPSLMAGLSREMQAAQFPDFSKLFPENANPQASFLARLLGG